MKNITGMLGGIFIATLALWGPGITLASAVAIGGVEIDKAMVLEALKDDPELQVEAGNLVDRLEAGDEGAKAEIDGFVGQIQQEGAAPAEGGAAPAEGGAAPAEGGAAPAEGGGTLGGEGVTATERVEATVAPESPVEAPEVQAPQPEIVSSTADIVAENNAAASITWCDGTVHPADEPDPGCP